MAITISPGLHLDSLEPQAQTRGSVKAIRSVGHVGGYAVAAGDWDDER